MTTTPESSSPNPQSGHISDFEAGLIAFKEAEYATAIVLLEPALAESLSHPLVAKAQMALAVSYEKMGETEQAVQLCQSLQQRGNAQVQDWATRTLASLTQRHPELERLQTETQPASRPSTIDSSQAASNPEPIGFKPLDEVELPPVTQPQWTEAAVRGITISMPESSPVEPAPSPSPQRSPKPAPSLTKQRLEPLTPPSLYQPHWKQAGRAQQWKSLGKVNGLKLLLTQIITAIAIYFAVQQLLYWTVASYGNAVLRTLPRLGFRIIQPTAPTWTEPFTLITLLILIVGSRWILDTLLKLLNDLKPLSLKELSVYSPEAAASLPRFCRKLNIPAPVLGIIPTATPVIFSYGLLPRISRTVVSKGLLEQLADDEIAALYANEVGNLFNRTIPLLSGITALLQLPYTLYWVTAEWANRKESPITKASATFITVISYSFFWLWRWAPLWLSRHRTNYSDRIASELTGNPNGYTRALLKLAIATAKNVQQQGQASYLLEGFEVLMPLGYRAAVPLGSLQPYTPLEGILEWERSHPLRHWLAINNTHPPTGSRLNLLMLYARHWRLDPELDWQNPEASRRFKDAGLSGQEWRLLLLQGSPYFGLALGVALALLLQIIGGIGARFQWNWVSWMAGDRTILFGLPLVGLCIGILIRLNPFFPDLPPQALKGSSPMALPSLLYHSKSIPLSSQPVLLEGTLLGRRGISNLLNQDLWLNTPNGLIKLHCTSRFGIFSSFFPQANRPATLIRQPVQATGWFRRGTTPWVDVETLRAKSGRVHHSYHPIWGFVIAAIAALWGIFTIFNFSF